MIEIKEKKEFSNAVHLEYFNELNNWLNDDDIEVLKNNMPLKNNPQKKSKKRNIIKPKRF